MGMDGQRRGWAFSVDLKDRQDLGRWRREHCRAGDLGNQTLGCRDVVRKQKGSHWIELEFFTEKRNRT